MQLDLRNFTDDQANINKTGLTTVEPAGKTSLLSVCILTMLTRQHNGK